MATHPRLRERAERDHELVAFREPLEGTADDLAADALPLTGLRHLGVREDHTVTCGSPLHVAEHGTSVVDQVEASVAGVDQPGIVEQVRDGGSLAARIGQDVGMGWLRRLRAARSELRVLAAAIRHERTPWPAKLLAVLVVAYAVSPIDLIPDPIPVLGLLDDAVLLPLGVLLVRRLVPADVLEECRHRPPVETSRTLRRVGLVLVVAAWIGTVALVWWLAT